jgi:hypothetical protein
VTTSERIAAGRRERRVLARVSRAAWRLDQAGRERTWALVSARAEGISIRTLAAAIGLSPSRAGKTVGGLRGGCQLLDVGRAVRESGVPAVEVAGELVVEHAGADLQQ